VSMAQDLAQELPQAAVALRYVEDTVRAFDGGVTFEPMSRTRPT